MKSPIIVETYEISTIRNMPIGKLVYQIRRTTQVTGTDKTSKRHVNGTQNGLTKITTETRRTIPALARINLPLKCALHYLAR